MSTCILRVALCTTMCACSFVLGPLRAVAVAQNTTATINGTVLDSQRLAVPGATLTIEERERGTKRTATSDAHGGFEIAGLAPGDYRLHATLSGSAAAELEFRLEVNQRLRVDVVVQASGVAENVVVRPGSRRPTSPCSGRSTSSGERAWTSGWRRSTCSTTPTWARPSGT